MGYEVIDVDFAIHVPVDNLRHIGSTLGSSKGGALPNPPGNQLKWTGGYFLARAGDTNNDALALTFVTALQCLAHHIDITNALEGIVHATIGHINNRLHRVVHITWINEVRHAETFS